MIDTFDGAKPRFLNRGKKRRSVSTLSIPRASDRGAEWVDFISTLPAYRRVEQTVYGFFLLSAGREGHEHVQVVIQ